MMYLFFDTETTGLPRIWGAPVTDLENWPRLVQLAYLLYDENGNKISAVNHIVKPENFVIPSEASRYHGITTERANLAGISVLTVLNEFQTFIDRAECLVAHNMNFDEKIIGAEFLRNHLPDSLAAKRKICTMQMTTNFCAIEGPFGYRWPRLCELFYKLFGTGFIEGQSAVSDIEATAKCFWELKRLGQI